MQLKPENRHAVTDSMKTYFEQTHAAVRRLDLNQMLGAVEILLDANSRGATIYIFGNGGSAATASHFANDLAKGCALEGRKRFRALALTDSITLMTAWANDTAYENIFAEQLKGLVLPGDVVIGISGSGNSLNVIRGIEAGGDAGAYTMGWSGYGGGKLRGLVDLAIHTDSTIMEQIEDIHLTLCHNITTAIKTVFAMQQLPVSLLV
ncbi:MAG: SIS domain-containing protein [Chloroflexi bacterium]|nr:SIS domain-containing protein [Chloroflexota bacterium]